MFKYISKYWAFQIIGWSANIAISMFFVFTFGEPSMQFFLSLLYTCIMGVVVTHIMRLNIFSLRVLEKTLGTQIVYFLILTLIFSILLGFVSETIDYLMGYNHERLEKYTRAQRLFISSFNAMWLLLIWNLIYFIYHYVERNRRQQMDTIRLESLVKSLELQTIKSHINPHFIFNALNSIRALVDENPARARKAITELSNILRSSLHAEQMETVPLQRELGIVKDYLALEQMRFEERLKVVMDIEENSLSQPVPPMMLQTLVENAIKHGISKVMDGGTIKITSRITSTGMHELIVRNSGKLNGNKLKNEAGFGIKSTQDRLQFLYQGKANFEIKDTEDGMVESKIVMPAVSEL